ncbi:MAG TPA: penicillin-binding protein 2 [Gemmatimonadaceae bacterium]|nr:penicillin-binding protein 2 [Gemmatimonadaceae bacterium]
MSFHPNDVARRGRAAALLSIAVMVVLLSAFFRTQVLGHKQWVLQSEENRLREVPIAAPRGIIYDRKGKIIAENVVGYSVSVLAQSEDSLRATMRRLTGTIALTPGQMELAVRRFKRAPTRPTVILNDAPFDVVSVLEEHRLDFPNLIILSAPKRFYPEGEAVASLVGYVNEISENELTLPQFETYKAGQQIGKAGLEKQYEQVLHGTEGSRFVEVDARNRIVREEGLQEVKPVQAASLQTNIDLDLQVYTAKLFRDSNFVGGAIAMDPETGAVLALHSAPSYDPNRFIGGIPFALWDSLQKHRDKPLYNKALQGIYPPASTWKLATAVLGLQDGAITPTTRMPQSCNGFYYYGSRAWRCWERGGHGSLDLTGAIAQSCDVYFYQLGLKLGLSRLVAGGVQLGFASKTGIDVPEEFRPIFPQTLEYFNRKYGVRGYTPGAMSLNMSIGQGENAQTVVNMARFYSALATDGHAAKPEIVKRNPERTKIMDLSPENMTILRNAMASVTAAGGTAASASLSGGVVFAGKTGTAQTASLEKGLCDHAWFVGFAPAEKPRVVVSVLIECGAHGYLAARIASAIAGKYLGVTPTLLMQTGG